MPVEDNMEERDTLVTVLPNSYTDHVENSCLLAKEGYIWLSNA
jgi:hypothetical protein